MIPGIYVGSSIPVTSRNLHRYLKLRNPPMYLESRNLRRFLELSYLHRYLESRNLHKFVESRKHMIRGTYYRQLHLIQLMRIDAALPADRRKAQFFITSLLS